MSRSTHVNVCEPRDSGSMRIVAVAIMVTLTALAAACSPTPAPDVFDEGFGTCDHPELVWFEVCGPTTTTVVVE